MSDHLPECHEREVIGLDCICDRLRACEQRVRDEDQRILIKYGAEQFVRGEVIARPLGYAAGVQAARDAVVALEPLLDKTKREGGYDCCGCTTPNDLYDDALAAIEALKEEQA